jgi:hypothetical protein
LRRVIAAISRLAQDSSGTANTPSANDTLDEALSIARAAPMPRRAKASCRRDPRSRDRKRRQASKACRRSATTPRRHRRREDEVSLAIDLRAALDHWRDRWDEVYGRACEAERKRIMDAARRRLDDPGTTD